MNVNVNVHVHDRQGEQRWQDPQTPLKVGHLGTPTGHNELFSLHSSTAISHPILLSCALVMKCAARGVRSRLEVVAFEASRVGFTRHFGPS